MSNWATSSDRCIGFSADILSYQFITNCCSISKSLNMYGFMAFNSGDAQRKAISKSYRYSRYVCNKDIHQGLKMPSVIDEIKRYATQHAKTS